MFLMESVVSRLLREQHSVMDDKEPLKLELLTMTVLCIVCIIVVHVIIRPILSCICIYSVCPGPYVSRSGWFVCV